MATLPLKTGLTTSQFKPSLHVECFTGDDLPTFITQTQTAAGKIPDEDKTLVGISKGAKLLASASESDTEVGERLKDSEIKILSKERNINWFQIEIQTSKSETKTLWIENNKEIQDKLKEKGNLKDLASTTSAWSKLPLQQSELTTSKNEVDTPSLLLNINDKDLIKNDKRAMDEKGTLWLWIEHAVDSQNVSIKGWTFIGSEGVKKVSGWEWFSFKQITETSSLKEFYLSAKKATILLWWDDFAKGLAKQSQQVEKSDTETKKKQSANTSSKKAKTSLKPATLGQNGRGFINSVAMVDYFNITKIKKDWAENPFAVLSGKVETNNDYLVYNQTRSKIKAFSNTN